jgi:hypothetical protein
MSTMKGNSWQSGTKPASVAFSLSEPPSPAFTFAVGKCHTHIHTHVMMFLSSYDDEAFHKRWKQKHGLIKTAGECLGCPTLGMKRGDVRFHPGRYLMEGSASSNTSVCFIVHVASVCKHKGVASVGCRVLHDKYF